MKELNSEELFAIREGLVHSIRFLTTEIAKYPALSGLWSTALKNIIFDRKLAEKIDKMIVEESEKL